VSTSASRRWRTSGKPWKIAQPIADLARILKARGYTIGTIGNDAHLNARTPEDHTPFSATGWPVPNPYPYIHACDIMAPPRGSGLPDLAQLGAQILADRNSGHAPVAWLKYMNWTTASGACRNESWKPHHKVRASNDRGHIHLSARTDFTRSTIGVGYDPAARVLNQAAPANTTLAAPAPPFGRTLRYDKGKPVMAGPDVLMWQHRMRARGWSMSADGEYGPESEGVCRKFQADKNLQADGEIGPVTWRATWESAVT
jgi:hypothetical protein